jgi:outer membrane protein assembly factor BamA
LIGQYVYRGLVEVEPGGLIATGSVPGASDGNILGLGAGITRDTRSSTIWPRRGSYHQLRGVFNGGVFGGDYKYGTFSLDLRSYVPISSNSVLALRGVAVTSTDVPPFDFMPQLGGDQLLRGFFAGRFRDLDLLAFQAEYRFPVWRRFGMVAFGSAGQVQPTLNKVTLDEFHAGAGFGIRFRLSDKEEINIRADFAWGLDIGSSGFYLGIGEAF